MENQELEFLISQYVDGTLDAGQSAALEARLRDDAGGRALLADHRRINTLLVERTALPEVRFDRFAEVVSQNLDFVQQQQVEQSSRLRFGRWVAGAAAVAACVVVGLLALRPADVGVAVPTAAVAGPKVVDVAGPAAEVSAAPRVALVTIDAPINATLYAALAWQDLSPSGARIVVSAGEPPAAPDALSGE